MSEEGGAVGPLTIIAVVATITIVVMLTNIVLSAYDAVFKNVWGTDVFMQQEYTAIWSKVSQFAWALIATAFAAAAFTVWRVIKER